MLECAARKGYPRYKFLQILGKEITIEKICKKKNKSRLTWLGNNMGYGGLLWRVVKGKIQGTRKKWCP